MADNNEQLETPKEGTEGGGSGSEGNQAQQQPQYTEAEERALAQGWVPKDQYTGSGKWRDAEEFLDRGELFSKIDEQSRKLKSTESTLEALKAHYKKVAETEYKRALADLRAQKKNALLEGDADAVIDIDEKIDAARAQAAQEQQQIDQRLQPQQSVPNPHFVAWVNRNPWYQNETAMKIFADTVGADLAAKGMLNPTQILEEVERQTKKEFAHKFNNPNRSKPGAVEGSTTRGSTKGDTFQLTAEETQVMKKLVRHGVMTEKEYIADIKAERGV